MLPPGIKIFPVFFFWHDFLTVFRGNEIVTYLTKRNLAYIALLAGWLCFCYWLYAKGIYPRIHGQEKSWPAYSTDIPFPLAFTWSSDIPLAGLGFGELKSKYVDIDSTDAMVIVRGYYFRDEADSLSRLQQLGRNRIESALKYIPIDDSRMVTEVLPQEVNGDVRSKPFEAVRFERIPMKEIVMMSGDTFEIYFPLKDSLRLPSECYQRLNAWIVRHAKKNERIMHVVGTADATGIAESSEQGFERALSIKSELMINGWTDENILISTGQRNQPLTLRNRCVIIYFE